MRVTTWGTRGAITIPGPEKVRYGANTSCVTVTSGKNHLILDAGIGIVLLGERIMASRRGREPLHLSMLLSHLHWDHVIGLPFFIPVFLPSTTFDIYGSSAAAMESATERLFTSTYSPIKGTENLGAELNYRDLGADPKEIAGFQVTSTPLRHPAGANAYRIEAEGQAVVYATDHEAGDKAIDGKLAELADGADILIHDAQWTRDEGARYRGAGHSTWADAVECAHRAGVGTLVLFHHHPHHDDATLDDIAEKSSAAANADLTVLVARDGMTVEP